MIRFERDGTQVKCTVEVHVPNYDLRAFAFMWECNKEVYAGLLSAHMQKKLLDALAKVRREGYEAGWKDAKAKRARRTEHYGYW